MSSKKMEEYFANLQADAISVNIVLNCVLLSKSYDVVYDRIEVLNGSLIHCGSTTEFFIRPMNPCVSDYDKMNYNNDELIFINEPPVLPHDVSVLSDMIYCLKIDPYPNYPGFVRMRPLGEMHYNWKSKRYDFKPYADTFYVKMIPYETDGLGVQQSVRGPASTLYHGPGLPSEDTVKCVWCPQWPDEAEEWPKRRRDYGWPTTDTISEVVQQGCHVVYVQHRACRNDELQWRLSFSVAEVILLQSWTQTQQIVYHLLRFFAKSELIQKHCPKEDEILCPYHLKTLMLWTLEETPPEWWNSSSVITICCKLLAKLLDCFQKGNLQNYFIRSANLFCENWNPEMLENTKRQLSRYCSLLILCKWFMGKYVLPVCIDLSAIAGAKSHRQLRVPRWMKSKSTDYMLLAQQLLCEIPYSDKDHSQRSLSNKFSVRRLELSRKISAILLPTPEIALYAKCLDAALLCLNAAYALEYQNISWDSELFVDFAKELFFKKNNVRCQFQLFPKSYKAEESQIQFLQALDFMTNLTESESHPMFKLKSLMSKGSLKKTLECHDSQSKIIAPAALVYLAALHFASSEYQTVIDLCSTVLLNPMTDVENETLNAGCLFFIDDVARIVGFCLMWKSYNENVYYYKRDIFHDLRLTPRVFAHYLTARSTESNSKQLESMGDPPTSALPLDQFFMVLTRQTFRTSLPSDSFRKVSRLCIYRRMHVDSLRIVEPQSMHSFKLKEELIDALTEYALEKMASFFDGIRTDFGIPFNTADCYRALYLYKCRQYDDTLHLCEHILKEPEIKRTLNDLALANVILLPSLICLFDGVVQCVVGFHTLFNYFSPVSVSFDIPKVRLFAESVRVPGVALFGDYLYRPSANSRSYPLSFLKQTAFHYFLGRHFLARYLKLRCIIDCNYPFAETLAEFSVMKCHLPLENTICQFIGPLLKISYLEK